MPKQMIEIDVPDGCQISGISQITYEDAIQLLISLGGEKPEFIEVWDFIAFDYKRIPIKLTLNADELHLAIESDDKTFIRGIDKEPRKVEI